MQNKLFLYWAQQIVEVDGNNVLKYAFKLQANILISFCNYFLY
jgi:hypothetical protein